MKYQKGMTNLEVANLLQAIAMTGIGDEVSLIISYKKRAKQIYSLLSKYMQDLLYDDFVKAGILI